MGKPISVTFSVDTKVYSMEAIYAASYVFIDRAYVYLSGNPRSLIKIRLKPKNGNWDFGSLRGEFMNELLNSALRVKISDKNKRVREYIVGAALLGATGEVPSVASGMADPVLEAVDDGRDRDFEVENNAWADDPLGIAIPWEEKYQNQNTSMSSCCVVPVSHAVNKDAGDMTGSLDEEISKYAALWSSDEDHKAGPIGE